MKKACIFCEIVKRRVSARIIHQEKNIIAFLPKCLNVKGHIIVAPARHWGSLFSMPEKEAAELMTVIKKVAGLIRKRLGAQGINILHASGKAAQQSVMHVHFHLFPRFRNDGIDAWPKVSEWHGNLDELADRLRGPKRGNIRKRRREGNTRV